MTPQLRIAFLKEKIRMTDVMDHFGHRYRLHGNMLCPWHDEKNPSARLYNDSDTMWCWSCSPEHGVDIVEFVVIELQLEVEVDTRSKLTAKQRRGLAVLRAIEYLEEAFNTGLARTPWEERMNEALHRRRPPENPFRYWRTRHLQLLRLLSRTRHPNRWDVYSTWYLELAPRRNDPISEQQPFWDRASAALAELEPETPPDYNSQALLPGGAV